MVLFLVLMALWQRVDCNSPVVSRLDHGTQCNCAVYQQVLASQNLVQHECSRSLGRWCCGPGVLRHALRELGHRHYYRSTDEARSKVFDFIERCYNPRVQPSLAAQNQKFLALTQLSLKAE